MQKFGYRYVQPLANGNIIESVGSFFTDQVVDTKFIKFIDPETGVHGLNAVVYLNGIGANKLMELPHPKEGSEIHLASVPNSIIMSHPNDVTRWMDKVYSKNNKDEKHLRQSLIDWVQLPPINEEE